MPRLAINHETFDFHKPFSIATGTIDCLTVLTVTLEDGGINGRGECVPSAERMVSREEGLEIAESVQHQIEGVKRDIEGGITTLDLPELLPKGPARNAVDCALWDLEAKRQRRPIAELLGLNVPHSLVTACTVSLDLPERMHQQALALKERKLIKVKLGGPDDEAAISAVRAGAPEADLIVDINGAWRIDQVRKLSAKLKKYGVKLLEQPVPAGNDEALDNISSEVPLCADESCHDRSDLDWVKGRYQYINIKLDKTGGLTEALALCKEARALGMGVMVGCMAGTSLSMAPAAIIGTLSEYVDLDGPLLLSRDRTNGLHYEDSHVYITNSILWG